MSGLEDAESGQSWRASTTVELTRREMEVVSVGDSRTDAVTGDAALEATRRVLYETTGALG